jgi:hypothetical protein
LPENINWSASSGKNKPMEAFVFLRLYGEREIPCNAEFYERSIVPAKKSPTVC